MKKIFCIPHHPGLDKIKIRVTELIKPLANEYDVYLLDWRYVEGRHTFLKLLIVALKDLFKRPQMYKKYGMTIVEYPVLHTSTRLARMFNRYMLLRFVKRHSIDVVFSGSYHMFTIPQQRGFKYLYDLADYPPYGLTDDTIAEIRRSDVCLAVSTVLAGYIKDHYAKDAIFVPNGAYIEKLRSVKREEVLSLRKAYNLENKFIIGYIGLIGSWVNIENVVAAFKIFKKDVPDAALMWIGMCPALEELRKKYGSENIIFTGGIKEDIEPYFNLLDVALLAHKKSLFQDSAFHLKLVEATAARKPVVSTPLKESMRLGFKNVFFADETPQQWADAFKKAKELKWDPRWDCVVEEYDWHVIASKLKSIIESMY